MIKILPIILLFSLHSRAQVISAFSLINMINKSEVSLSDFNQERGIVIIFTSTDCPYVDRYHQRLLDLQSRFTNQGFQFLLINSDNHALNPEIEKSKMMAQVTAMKYPFPYLEDNNQLASQLLGASKAPEVFLLKPKSLKFEVIYSGAIDDNPQNPEDVRDTYLEEALKMVIQERPVHNVNNRAVGCRIKT